MLKVVLDFLKYSDANLDVKANFIYSSMNGNANFPNPTVSLTDLNAATKGFGDAITAAKTRDSVKIAARQQMRQSLEDILRELARYVNFIANGDRKMLISSGFTIGTETKSPVQLSTPQNFTVVAGLRSGEVIISVDPVEGAKAYLFLFGPAPIVNGAWQHVISKTPSVTIENLESMKQHCFCVGVLGPNEQKVYTEIITKGVV